MGAAVNDDGQCPDCCEVVEGEFQYHESCCPHDNTEDIDDRDGVRGTLWVYCYQCAGDVTEEMQRRGEAQDADKMYDSGRDGRMVR